jgi:hypothetical protein
VRWGRGCTMHQPYPPRKETFWGRCARGRRSGRSDGAGHLLSHAFRNRERVWTSQRPLARSRWQVAEAAFADRGGECRDEGQARTVGELARAHGFARRLPRNDNCSRIAVMQVKPRFARNEQRRGFWHFQPRVLARGGPRGEDASEDRRGRRIAPPAPSFHRPNSISPAAARRSPTRRCPAAPGPPRHRSRCGGGAPFRSWGR